MSSDEASRDRGADDRATGERAGKAELPRAQSQEWLNSKTLFLARGLHVIATDIAPMSRYRHTTTPVEGALEWSVQKSRRSGGARAGGFLGAETILAQFDKGRHAPPRRLEAGRARARARRRLVIYGQHGLRADRQGYLGRIWSDPERAGSNALSSLSRCQWLDRLRRSARPAPADAGRAHAVRSQYL